MQGLILSLFLSPLNNESVYSPAMTARSVHWAFFTANNKVVDISNGEGHASNSHSLGLFVNQLHAIL